MLGSRVFEEYVSVKDYGAVGDGVTDDTAAIQAAANYCFGTVASPHGYAGRFSNKTLFFPPGDFLISDPINFKNVCAGKIIGSGKGVTHIKNNASNEKVFYFNGIGYTLIADMNLEGTGTTGICLDLNWDGSGDQGTQANLISNVAVGVCGTGCAVSLAGNMGSEIVFLSCHFTQCAQYGLEIGNYNALQMSVLGGNFQDCDVGIYVPAGSVPVIHGVGFQNGNSNTADIYVVNSAGDTYHIAGCRSESKNFAKLYSGIRGGIYGCVQLNATDGNFLELNDIPKFVVEGCNSLNGKLTGNIRGPVRISQSQFGRSDWNQLANNFGDGNGDIEIEGVEYNYSATSAFIARQRISASNGSTYNYAINGPAHSYTVASGVVTTLYPGWIKVDTQGGAGTDDLDTITLTGALTGDVLIVSSTNSGRDTTLKDGTGNLHLAGDFVLTNTDDRITLQYDGTNWVELARSDNA